MKSEDLFQLLELCGYIKSTEEEGILIFGFD